jgi:hypothetical protein
MPLHRSQKISEPRPATIAKMRNDISEDLETFRAEVIFTPELFLTIFIEFEQYIIPVWDKSRFWVSLVVE